MSEVSQIKKGRPALPVQWRFQDNDGNWQRLRFADEDERAREEERRRKAGLLYGTGERVAYDRAKQRFVAVLNQSDYAPGAVEARERLMEVHLDPRFKKGSIRDVTATAIIRAEKEIRLSHGPNVWANVRVNLVGIVKAAISRGWIAVENDPFVHIPVVPPEFTPQLRRHNKLMAALPLLSLEERSKILWETTGWENLACAITLGSGLRSGELRVLVWSDIAFDKKRGIAWIKITRAEKKDRSLGPPKTKAGKREIPVRGRLYRQLLALDPGSGHRNGLVVTADGSRLTHHQLLRAVRRAQVSIGIGREFKRDDGRLAFEGTFTLRDMRHTYAAWLIWNRVPDNMIRIWMGHRWLQTTLDVYGYIFRSLQNDAPAWPRSFHVEDSGAVDEQNRTEIDEEIVSETCDDNEEGDEGGSEG